MFQPFERFRVEYIDRLLRMDKRYLVSQRYDKAFEHFEEIRTDLLLTDYDEPGLAQIHFSAVKGDRYAAIIDLGRPKHREKLVEMLKSDSSYRLFWAIVQSAADVKSRIDRTYKDHIRRYLMRHTGWRIDGSLPIRGSVQVIYGELFLILKRGNQTVRVKFEEIENA